MDDMTENCAKAVGAKDANEAMTRLAVRGGTLPFRMTAE
jgi:hypothetical protein